MKLNETHHIVNLEAGSQPKLLENIQLITLKHLIKFRSLSFQKAHRFLILYSKQIRFCRIKYCKVLMNQTGNIVEHWLHWTSD